MGRVPLPGKRKHSETNWNFENARPSTFFSVKIKLNFHRKKSARASIFEIPVRFRVLSFSRQWNSPHFLLPGHLGLLIPSHHLLTNKLNSSPYLPIGCLSRTAQHAEALFPATEGDCCRGNAGGAVDVRTCLLLRFHNRLLRNRQHPTVKNMQMSRGNRETVSLQIPLTTPLPVQIQQSPPPPSKQQKMSDLQQSSEGN